MTTRANPASSFSVASRHLFRHLNEHRELRRNPLVRWYFAPDSSNREGESALIAIRDAVRRYADALLENDIANRRRDLGRRRHAIVVKGDLESVPREELCAQLGLSERQFYRDQMAIHRQIADVFARNAQRRTQITLAPRMALDETLMQARVLDDLGMPHEAIKRLDDVLAGSSDTYAKSKALYIKADINCDMLRFEESVRELDDAQRLDEGLDASSRLECDVAISLLRAEIALARGDMGSSNGTLERAFALLGPAQAYEERFRELRSQALFTLAQSCVILEGATRRAFDALDAAGKLANTVRERAPSKRIDFLLLSGSLATSRLGRIPDAFRAYEEALELALRHGLAKKVANCHVWLASLHHDCGNAGQAKIFLERAIRKLSEGGNPALLGIAYRVAAELSVDTNAPAEALEISHAALRCAPEESKQWVETKAAQALAWLELGDPQTALRVAMMADQAAVRQTIRSVRAVTLRSLALAHHSLGNKRQAIEAIASALECANGTVNLARKALVLDAAATIWGSTSHRRAAQSIRSGLTYTFEL